MRKNLLFFVIMYLICYSTTISAQEIQGTVVDEQMKSIEFATVGLYNSLDSSLVCGVITDSLGVFRLKIPTNIVLSDTYIEISYVGFASVIVSNPSLSVGVIVLNSAIHNIEEVTILARKKIYKMEANGISASIEHTPLSELGDAENVLNRLPLVNVRNGEVAVWGKGTPTIYIDDRLVYNNEELHNLSSNQIKKIRVITNPGAEYGVDINSVILITTIKTMGEGLGGYLYSYNDMGNRFGTSNRIKLNYQNKGLDVLTNVRWDDKEYHKRQNTNQLMGIHSLSMPTDEVMHNRSLIATASVNYEANERHTMGARYNFDYDPLNSFNSFTNYTINENDMGSIIHSVDNMDNPWRGRLNAYYKGIITDKFTLRADFDFVQNKTSQIMHSISQQIQENDDVVTAQSKSNASVYGGKIQGVTALFKGELTLGGEMVKSINEQKYIINNAQNITPKAENKAQTDILASFISYQISINEMFLLQTGLRYEHSSFNYSIDGIPAPQQSKNYNQWAPSISVGYMWKFINIGVNYGRRISKPSYYQLRNDVQYSTPYLYESGNPFLKPTISNDIGLNIGLGSLSIMAIYSKISDMIVYSLSDYNSTGVMLFKPENVNKSENFGLMFSVDASFNVCETTLEAGYQKQFLSWGSKTFNKPIYTIGMNNIIKLPKGISLIMDINYASRGNTSTVYTDNSFVTDIFLSKWFFNKTLRVNMGLDNIFNAKETWKLELDGFSMYKDCNNDSRRVFVSIYFRFNDSAKSRFKGEKSTDEIDRI